MNIIRLRRLFIAFLSLCFAFFACAGISHAHEVYVLSQDEIRFALSAPSPDFLATIRHHLGQFLLWGFFIFSIIAAVFLVSVIRPLERAIDPFLNKLKLLAPRIAQATLGISLLASGYYRSLFGVELPMQAMFGSYVPLMRVLVMAVGALLLLGIVPRLTAFICVALFFVLLGHYGIYMSNYATYLGEALTVFLFGGAYHLIESRKLGYSIERAERRIVPHLHKYKFLVMRVLFGFSLLYASIYAKFIHGALALETVSKYHLTNYFHFDPTFLVFGAMATEVVLGLFFILGFELRFASLFFLVFLVMSLLFFGEVVWPHLILIGTALAMFAHGYDRYCLSAKLSRQKNLEPVL